MKLEEIGWRSNWNSQYICVSFIHLFAIHIRVSIIRLNSYTHEFFHTPISIHILVSFIPLFSHMYGSLFWLHSWRHSKCNREYFENCACTWEFINAYTLSHYTSLFAHVWVSFLITLWEKLPVQWSMYLRLDQCIHIVALCFTECMRSEVSILIDMFEEHVLRHKAILKSQTTAAHCNTLPRTAAHWILKHECTEN